MVLGHPSVAQTTRALRELRLVPRNIGSVWECWATSRSTKHCWEIPGKAEKCQAAWQEVWAKCSQNWCPKNTHTHTHTHTYANARHLGSVAKHYPTCWHVRDHAEKHASTSGSPWVKEHLHWHHDKNPKYPIARLRPTLDQGPGSNFLGTNLDWFESLSWTVPWSLAWFLVLQIRSSPFSTVFWSEPIDFPSETGAM